jgi:hypothetical protein
MVDAHLNSRAADTGSKHLLLFFHGVGQHEGEEHTRQTQQADPCPKENVSNVAVQWLCGMCFPNLIRLRVKDQINKLKSDNNGEQADQRALHAAKLE